ncbi:MAG: hypothetical protein BGO49_11995 [Planctomycetales bacterium 71-10]|nr:MAG: hypothetical protein BGO49_11995 [Planctomycetales bacterium 71-10]
MALPLVWQVVAASLLATALFAATAALVLARRMVALGRAHEAAEHRLTHLACEVRRLERLVAEATRRGAAIPTSRAAEPLVPLISIPDLSREGEHDAAGLAEKHGEVWALVEAGRTPREIADEIGRPIGEVELIAGLHRQHLAAHPRGRHDD